MRSYFNGNMNNYGHTYSNNNNNNNNNRNDLNYRNNYSTFDKSDININNNNNHNSKNNNNLNKKQNSSDLNQDVRSHPYASSPYVQSLCPELVHANILTVSKGPFLPLFFSVNRYFYILCVCVFLFLSYFCVIFFILYFRVLFVCIQHFILFVLVYVGCLVSLFLFFGQEKSSFSVFLFFLLQAVYFIFMC
jgi:hypothetical protein